MWLKKGSTILLLVAALLFFSRVNLVLADDPSPTPTASVTPTSGQDNSQAISDLQNQIRDYQQKITDLQGQEKT